MINGTIKSSTLEHTKIVITRKEGAGRMFLSGLDEIDQKITALLLHNARMSYSDIGEAVGAFPGSGKVQNSGTGGKGCD